MSVPEEIAEIAADGVADGLHVVSEEALVLEEATRGLQAVNLAYFGLGLAAGAAIGGFVAFRLAYRKAEEKAHAIADEEIAEMQEHYRQKETARDNEVGKGDLTEIVKNRGYASEENERPPMAITPPAAVVDRAAEIAEAEDEADGEPEPEKPRREPENRNIFKDNAPPEDTWDWHQERRRRSPNRPYVIHRDERDERDAYDHVTFTYYEEDDVVCNEMDEVQDSEERERIIGEDNLSKFGHGSGESSTVYVRNDQMATDIVVHLSPNSYLEEVHGIEPEIRHMDRRGRRHIEDE